MTAGKTHVLRFMSANEAIKLLQGERLHNETNHRETGNSSDSIGFCFAIMEGGDIYQHATYLSGITNMGACLIGKLKPEIEWIKNKARFSAGMRTELCTTDYDLNDFSEWSMYTPKLDEGIQLMAPSSRNWDEPVLATKGGSNV